MQNLLSPQYWQLSNHNWRINRFKMTCSKLNVKPVASRQVTTAEISYFSNIGKTTDLLKVPGVDFLPA